MTPYHTVSQYLRFITPSRSEYDCKHNMTSSCRLLFLVWATVLSVAIGTYGWNQEQSSTAIAVFSSMPPREDNRITIASKKTGIKGFQQSTTAEAVIPGGCSAVESIPRGGSAVGVVGTLLKAALRNPVIIGLLMAQAALSVYGDSIPGKHTQSIVKAALQASATIYFFHLLLQWQAMNQDASNES